MMTMQTSTTAVSGQADHSKALGDQLADERVISEQNLADLLGTHIQQIRVARRKDADAGTVGERTPIPIWISDRRVGYQVKHVKAWLARRTVDTDHPADTAQ